MLVCRRWREVGEGSPGLWTWLTTMPLCEMIHSERILMATNMRVENYLVTDESLQAW